MKLPVMGKEAVGALVPHKRSMLLLDGIRSFDRKALCATSLMVVGKDNIFYDQGLEGIPSYVCFELMAQTISAYDFLMHDEQKSTPKIGFILGVNHLVLAKPFLALGKRVETTIWQDCAIGGAMYAFKGRSIVDHEEVASATLMVYTVLDPKQFLE